MTGLYSAIINLFPFKPPFSKLGHGFGALEHRFWMDFPDLGRFLMDFGWIFQI